jgi:predicted transcriptional regulator
VSALIKGEKEFSEELKKTIEDLGMDISDFAEKCGIPYSTLYKIVNGQRYPTIKTLRKILSFFKQDGEFLAVIAAGYILEDVSPFKFDARIHVKPYPATNFEEAIIMAVRAEKEGAIGIVCAPVLSPTIEKIVDIPVFTMKPKESVLNAITQAIKKLMS